MQVNKFWLADYETMCERTWSQADDPKYPGVLPDHDEVSTAYLTAIQKSCASVIGRLQK